ncbi:hypothetical protein RJ640_020718 [Escallonia rubra]|uniref:Uncharacterized protein n=1 Tax=Escallonia rubra TaxID=112253 RepID=A0AA88S2S3_9ASTE|nr:hypothetical protein RJ640_020718 [Escallonia rubra]
MDPDLGKEYPLRAAAQAAELILNCLESDPKNRPGAEELVEALEQISAIKINPKGSNAGSRQPTARPEESTPTNYRRHNHHRSPLNPSRTEANTPRKHNIDDQFGSVSSVGLPGGNDKDLRDAKENDKQYTSA